MKKLAKTNDNGTIEVDVKSVNFLELLFLLFLGLKLADKIDWSWWWVFAPLWIPLALAAGIAILSALGMLLGKAIKKL